MTILDSIVTSPTNVLLYNGADDFVEALGYYAPYDGGGGMFHWLLTAQLPLGITDDHGFFFDSDPSLTSGPHMYGTGMWVRDDYFNQTDCLNVKWFGAKGDHSAHDETSINNALVAGAKSRVFFPSGIYHIYDELVVSSDTYVYGEDAIIQIMANNINCFSVTSQTNVSFDRLKLVGNNTSSDFINGNGIFFDSSTRINVSNCQISHFGKENGASSSGCGILCYTDCSDINIQGNRIEAGEGALNNSDILIYGLYGFSGDANITDNFCLSNNSQGIYVNATGVTGKIVITGNHCYDHTRHGIIGAYDTSDPIDTIISGNICYNNPCTGIYLAAQSEGVVVTNNIIDCCSGSGPNEDTICGGIALLGTKSVICSGNMITNTGYKPDGDVREGFPHAPVTASCAIRINGYDLEEFDSNEHLSIVQGNMIKKSAGMGIHIYQNVSNILCTDNSVTQTENTGIRVQLSYTSSPSGIFVRNVSVTNNVIDCSVYEVSGIILSVDQDGNKGIIVDNNHLLGITAIEENPQTYGIRISVNTSFDGSVSGNYVDTWNVGISVENGAQAIKTGTTLLMNDNNICNCDNGVYMYPYSGGSPVYSFGKNYYSGNGSDIDATAAFYREALAIYPTFIWMDTDNPASATPGAVNAWKVGDKVINSAPSVGNPMGWVCVTAGTPGTWASEPNL